MPPERVAFFLPNLRGGGAERTMSILANSMAQRGLAVDFVLVQADGSLLSTLQEGVHIVDLAASSTYACLPNLVRYLRRNNPSVLVSALDLTNYFAVAARILSGWRGKLFLRLDNTQTQIKRSRLKKWMEAILIKVLYPFANGIIAVSQGVKDDFVKSLHFPASCIRVIYNPILTQHLTEKAAQPLQGNILPDDHTPFFLGVGRLNQQKNFRLLIDAFSILHHEFPQTRLLVLGEGEERPQLEAHLAELGLSDAVSLPGYVENPYSFMAHAAAFVLSSDYEGLPTVLVEAMACGCTVISTDCPSGPAEITAQGKYGYLTPVGDALALAKAMRQALSGQKRLASTGWLDQFCEETAVEKYLELFFPTI